MKALIQILAVLVLGLLFAFPLMWMMNYVFSAYFLSLFFGAAQIGFWKAYVLSIVTGWLFKSSTVNFS